MITPAKIQKMKKVIALALRKRKEAGYSPIEALCVYDAAEKLGVEVRFLKIPSLEGIYINKKPPEIFLSSLRPAVRQTFNCAHELGHHFLNHGMCIEKIAVEYESISKVNNQEFYANLFAGFFLMPKVTVEHAFAARRLNASASTPMQIYSVACWLGVGYSTLVHHMSYSLGLIEEEKADSLLAVKPKEIKTCLLGMEMESELFVVDDCWVGRPIDFKVGNLILAPKNTRAEGPLIELVREDDKNVVFRAIKPGSGARLSNKSWASFIRVARQEYEGRSIFRHLEEEDE